VPLAILAPTTHSDALFSQADATNLYMLHTNCNHCSHGIPSIGELDPERQESFDGAGWTRQLIKSVIAMGPA
jgi:hypothetical protein